LAFDLQGFLLFFGGGVAGHSYAQQVQQKYKKTEKLPIAIKKFFILHSRNEATSTFDSPPGHKSRQFLLLAGESQRAATIYELTSAVQ